VFVIAQEQAHHLAWPAPGTLFLVCRDGRFAFADVSTQTLQFTRNPPSTSYVDPIMSSSGDGRWLVAHRITWDLKPAVAAPRAGRKRVPEPVRKYADEDVDYLVSCLYAISQDGRLALRCVGKDLRTEPVQQLLNLPDFDVRGPCPEPDRGASYAAALSSRFVVWFNRRVPPYKEAQVFSLDSGKVLATLSHPQAINSVIFSRDGTRCATAAGRTVRVWDPESGECVRRFKAQRGNVQTIAFHPSGRYLAVAGQDETVRFQDVASGKELGSYAWNVGKASQLAFSPDGLMVAARTPGAVVVWDVDA
jgi:hypothetical protein